MSYLKVKTLANKFANKLSKIAQQPIVSQSGTTELFFGDASKQQAFSSAVSKDGTTMAKLLVGVATKTQQTASFNLQASAEPHKGAQWILQVIPPAIKGQVSAVLDTELKKITGKGLAETQKLADTGAKAGSGSGSLNIASFSADMD